MAAAAALTGRWTRQTLPRLLLVIGAESALREEAIAAAKAAAFGAGAPNMVVLHGPASRNDPEPLTPADFLDDACTASMFAAADDLKLVLVRQADVFLSDKEWREILERNVERIPPTATLILEAATFGQLKSTRLYKGLAAAKAVVECDPLAGKYGDSPELELEVQRRAQARGLNLSHGALLALLNRSAKNLAVLDEELGKLELAFRPASASLDGRAQGAAAVTITEQHVEELCASTNTYNAFNFADAVLARDAKNALEVLGGIFSRGVADSSKPGRTVTNESALVMLILGALTWKLSQLQDAQAALESGRREFDVFGELKVFGFRQEALRRLLRKHTGVSLRRCMDALYRAYLDLRLSGMTPQEVLEQMLWRMVKA